MLLLFAMLAVDGLFADAVAKFNEAAIGAIIIELVVTRPLEEAIDDALDDDEEEL